MNSIFNQGGKGSTGISANKQSIARVFNVKQNEVAYLEVGSPVTGYQILYDKATQTCWLNTATGTVVSWDIVDASMTLVTSTGSYTLVQGVSNYNLGYGVEGQDIVGQTEARIAALATNVIRVCTWNIQNGYINFGYYSDPDGGDALRFNKDEDSPLYMAEINEHMLRMGLDIVGMQEVLHRWDAPINLRALYPYVDAAEGRTDLDADGVTANRVYSNSVMGMHKITSSSNTVLRPREPSSDGNGLLKTVMTINGVTISFYNTHLYAYDDTIRLQQLDTIAGILQADTNTHIILTGDFNLHLDSQFAALTNIGFNMVNNQDGPNTYNGTKGWEWHMDRIFHKGFSAQGTWNVDEIPRELGDHKPVWVDLTL